MPKRPIGIFDSGVGGLTVVKSLIQQLPDESFIYIGDTAHVPYGNKTEKQLFSYAYRIIDYFIQRRVKAIIVACGTHSSVTLPALSQEYSLPIIGVVKAGAYQACRVTRKGLLGVLATQATVNSLAYTREINRIKPDYKVYEVGCPRLVPLIEAGKLRDRETVEAVEDYLSPLLAKGIDTLILGCTHYPFLSEVIRSIAGENVVQVDPSWQTIQELIQILSEHNLYNQSNETPLREFYVSGQEEPFFDLSRVLIGEIVNKVHKIYLD